MPNTSLQESIIWFWYLVCNTVDKILFQICKNVMFQSKYLKQF